MWLHLTICVVGSESGDEEAESEAETDHRQPPANHLNTGGGWPTT